MIITFILTLKDKNSICVLNKDSLFKDSFVLFVFSPLLKFTINSVLFEVSSLLELNFFSLQL